MLENLWEEAGEVYEKIVKANELSYVDSKLFTIFAIRYIIAYTRSTIHCGLIIFLSFYTALRIAVSEGLPMPMQLLSIIAIAITLPLVCGFIMEARGERFLKAVPKMFQRHKDLWKK